jgi:type IV pilus assembly protein PilF
MIMTMTSPTTGRWPLRLCAALALLGALAGCATQGGAGGGAPGELHTTSDDSDARKRARTRVELAASYLQNEQTAVALDELKKAMQIDPTFSDAYNLGGLIYLSMDQRQMAQSHFERAVALDGYNADALHNLGWMQCQGGQYAAAEQAFARAIAIPMYANRARTLMAQGVCQARAGDKTAAEATLLRSYEIDPGNPVTAYNLAALLYQRGDYTRSQFYVRRLNNGDLSNAESLWLGIRIERKLDNRVAMEQLASQLRRRFPESSQLRSFQQGAFDE